MKNQSLSWTSFYESLWFIPFESAIIATVIVVIERVLNPGKASGSVLGTFFFLVALESAFWAWKKKYEPLNKPPIIRTTS